MRINANNREGRKWKDGSVGSRRKPVFEKHGPDGGWSDSLTVQVPFLKSFLFRDNASWQWLILSFQQRCCSYGTSGTLGTMRTSVLSRGFAIKVTPQRD